MKLAQRHPWNLDIPAARRLQESLAQEVVVHDDLGTPQRVAGVDVGFEDHGRTTRAAVAVLALPALTPLAQAVARRRTRFPYVPGYLSFREIPAVLAALKRLRQPPDVLLCDGQGYAHPRRFGLACHLGVYTGLPSIGVAKTRLIGSHGRVPERRGGWCELRDGDEVIGAVLRTRAGIKPVYVSIGHRVSLETAIDIVMQCTTRYRLPETTRAAHRLASG